jgi:hypothetical protein
MVDDLTREEAPHENGGNAIRLEPLSAAWDADASLSKYVNMWNTYIDGLNIFLSPIVHIIKFILMPCFIISKNAYDITITNSIRQFIRPVKSNIYIILFSSLTVMLLSVGFYKHSTIASVSNTISVYIINYIVSAIPKSFILAFILQNGEITTGASIVFFSFLFLIMFILSLWLVYFIIAIYIRLEIPRRHKEYITLINNLRLYNGDGATQTKDYRVTNEYVNVDLAAYTISAEKKYQLMANDSAIFKEARSEIIQRGRFGPRKIKRAVNRLRVLISMLSE